MNQRKSHPDCDICNARHRYQREKFARWKAAGLCPYCGGERSRYLRCPTCRKSNAAEKRRKYAMKKAA